MASTPQVPNRFQDAESDSMEDGLESVVWFDLEDGFVRSISPARTSEGFVEFDDDVSTVSWRSYGYREVEQVEQVEHTGQDDDDNGSAERINEHEEMSRDVNPGDTQTDPDIEASPKTNPPWQPYTLRSSFLIPFSVLTLGLCLTTLLLFWRSQTNYGLGNDDGSSGLLFGWRFSPTLIAVIYVELCAILFQDIRRTEPYARLARPDGATASASILQKPGTWWNVLYDGFSKNGKGRSRALICVTLVTIVGFLAILPLSSAFLTSEDVEVSRSATFSRLTTQSNSSMVVDADRTTRFRVIANLLNNVSTSPWITDECTMLPFWPSDWTDAPLTSLPSDLGQTWKAKTTVFKSELNCTAMTLEGISTQDTIFESINAVYPAVSALWSSNDCFYGVDLPNISNIVTAGGASWSSAADFGFTNYIGNFNHSSQCDSQEILILTDGWNSSSHMEAQLCTNTYSMANVTASVVLNNSTPEISFDPDEYTRNRIPVPDTLFNTTRVQELALTPDWSSYTKSLLGSDNPPAYGELAVLLGALYDYNLTALVTDPDVASQAAKVKQRLFGEILQSSLTQDGQRIPIKGRIQSIERRIVVVAGPAIAIGVLLFISFCLVLAVWWLTRLKRRPLNLSRDPATVLTMGSLIAHDRNVRLPFDGLDQLSNKELEETLKTRSYYTEPGRLFEMNANRPEQIENNALHSEHPKKTPLILRLPILLTLLISLIAIVVGIAILHHYASDSAHHKAFIYQARIIIFHRSLPTVAPYSMIPTIIAVGIGLWWSAIDNSFRRLQPFIAMANERPSLSKGAGLSYHLAYWMWGPVKAAMNSHWLLFLVTFGTSLSPIFTIAMSGLFQHTPGNIKQSITLPRNLEIRQTPHLFRVQTDDWKNTGDTSFQVMQEVTRNISANWMFTAPAQITLNSSDPPWSKDGWSFVPIDLDTVSNGLSIPVSGSWEGHDSTKRERQVNVSFSTPAIRGRIECTPLDGLENLSSWLTTWDMTDPSIWENESNLTTGYELGRKWGMEYNPSLIIPEQAQSNLSSCPGCTSMLNTPKQVLCCANESSTTETGDVAFGYWSPNSNPIDNWTPQSWQRSFTIKWITGNATSNLESWGTEPANENHLIFTDVPSIAGLNCQPLVETANATVTVNPRTGEIGDFEIIGSPEIASDAFSDDFVVHDDSYFDYSTGDIYYNSTVSYGNLFMSVMLTKADESGMDQMYEWGVENLADNTYNFRDNTTGLNMDYMTYSMFTMANEDPDALLNSTTLQSLAQKTFTTFFQHLVSDNISTTGGWAYQPINASLPDDLAPAANGISGEMDGQSNRIIYRDDLQPVSSTKQTVEAVISQHVELFHMNPAAVWLSVAILGWLIITTVIVAILQRRYLNTMLRDVECLADVLVLVAGSENLLRVMEMIRDGKLSKTDYQNLCTRLGWFIGGDGKVRWGIEMEERFRDGPEVIWISPENVPQGNHIQPAINDER